MFGLFLFVQPQYLDLVGIPSLKALGKEMAKWLPIICGNVVDYLIFFRNALFNSLSCILLAVLFRNGVVITLHWLLNLPSQKMRATITQKFNSTEMGLCGCNLKKLRNTISALGLQSSSGICKLQHFMRFELLSCEAFLSCTYLYFVFQTYFSTKREFYSDSDHEKSCLEVFNSAENLIFALVADVARVYMAYGYSPMPI